MSALSRLAREKPILLVAWLLAAVFAARYLYADFWFAYHDERGLWGVAANTKLGRDFVNVFTGGHLVLQGKLGIVYDIAAYREFQLDLFDGAVRNHNYSYAPVSFFYVWLFALVPYGTSYWLWTGLTGAAFWWAARPYLKAAGLPTILAVLTPAAAANVWAGHYGFLIGALWLGAWRLVETRPRTAGVLVGLMIVKPHLAVLMPLALARRRAWSPFAFAGLTSLGLVLASGLVFGWQHWTIYLTETSAVQASMLDNVREFFLKMMPTVVPSAMIAGAGLAWAWSLQILFALGAIAALWLRMPKDPLQAGLAAGVATFLVLPYAFNYDMTVVALAAMVLLHRWAGESPIRAAIAMLAFLLPLTVINLGYSGAPVGPLLLAGLLWLALEPRAYSAARCQAGGSSSPLSRADSSYM